MIKKDTYYYIRYNINTKEYEEIKQYNESEHECNILHFSEMCDSNLEFENNNFYYIVEDDKREYLICLLNDNDIDVGKFLIECIDIKKTKKEIDNYNIEINQNRLFGLDKGAELLGTHDMGFDPDL